MAAEPRPRAILRRFVAINCRPRGSAAVSFINLLALDRRRLFMSRPSHPCSLVPEANAAAIRVRQLCAVAPVDALGPVGEGDSRGREAPMCALNVGDLEVRGDARGWAPPSAVAGERDVVSVCAPGNDSPDEAEPNRHEHEFRGRAAQEGMRGPSEHHRRTGQNDEYAIRPGNAHRDGVLAILQLSLLRRITARR
jgi:hypothetical protein